MIFGFAVFIVAVATRLTHLNAVPFYDELYHILAAQSWLENGTFTIYQGEYTRTPFYTILTAWMFDLAGGADIAMARAPNVVFGALLAAGAAVWTRQLVGPLAGWIVALCVLFWPSGIHLSQIVRFYALHGLLFFIGAVATYDLFRPEAALLRRLTMAAIAIAALWSAKQFQDSTLVGAAGLALWVGFCIILPAIFRLRNRNAILLAGAAAVLLAVGAAIASGHLPDLWAGYRSSPWDRDPTAYHRLLRDDYPLFWPATPVLAIFAIRNFPRPASFCTTLIVFGILVHSFAGVQNVRHIYYLLPFLFALWAMGLQAVLPSILDHLRSATESLSARIASPVLATPIVICAMLFALVSSNATVEAIKLIKGNIILPFHKIQSWAPARGAITRYVENGAVFVVTDDLAALYYIGMFDVTFSSNWLPEMQETEFARDPRTGRPLISSMQSLKELVQAYPEGIFVASQDWWTSWPGSHNITAFLNAFEAPNTEWSIEEAGWLSILHWKTETPSGSSESARIRELVDEN